MYATSFSSPVSNARAGVEYSQDQTAVENAKKAQAEAEARAAAFSKKENYTVQSRDDGGFGFYGPDGKEISASQYANNTGQKLTDILKDSQNPIDVRYIKDQKAMTDYLQAKAGSKFDPKQAAIAKQIEDQVKGAYGYDLHKADWRETLNLMQQNYPTIYGAHQDNSPGFSGSNTFLPPSAGAQSQAEANNPLGFYQSQSSGGLGGLKKKK